MLQPKTLGVVGGVGPAAEDAVVVGVVGLEEEGEKTAPKKVQGASGCADSWEGGMVGRGDRTEDAVSGSGRSTCSCPIQSRWRLNFDSVIMTMMMPLTGNRRVTADLGRAPRGEATSIVIMVQAPKYYNTPTSPPLEIENGRALVEHDGRLEAVHVQPVRECSEREGAVDLAAAHEVEVAVGVVREDNRRRDHVFSPR